MFFLRTTYVFLLHHVISQGVKCIEYMRGVVYLCHKIYQGCV